jgi:hypothetical protein
MQSFKMIFLWVFIFSMVGCFAHQHEMGRKIDPDKAVQIIEGKTTESEAISLLGEPQSVQTLSDGRKIVGYKYFKTQIYGRPCFSDAKGETSHQFLMLAIKNGVVVKKMESSSTLPTQMLTGQTLNVPDKFK